MANVQHLVYAFLKFLDDQQRSPDLSPDAIEGLEVAAQCLETAYGTSIRDVDAAARYPMPASLPEIFAAGLAHMGAFSEPSAAEKQAAEKLKTEGNELMKQEQFTAAVECYTKALQIDGRNAVYYCNRAAAFGKLGEHQKSIDDCRKALDLDPMYGKAFGRMGLAYNAIGRHADARQCFQKALSVDPTNEMYKENLRHCEELAMGSGGMGGLNLGGLGGLDLSSLLSNPALMNMATSMLSNPQMQQMMANLMAGGGVPPAPGAAPGPAPGPVPNLSTLLQAGQQLAQQMQQTNPELVEQLRTQMRTEPSDNDSSPPDEENKPSGGS